jgi:hypothetical protein
MKVRASSFLLAALLVATGGLGRATAQTVIVQGAPAGAAVEVTMNGGAAVSATANSLGDATLAVPATTPSAVVQIHLDACGSTVRVLVIERGVPVPTAGAGCQRIEGGSNFSMTPATTFVVDIEGTTASVHLRQGPAPREWLRGSGEGGRGARRPWGTPPKGLVLSAGAGLSRFGNTIDAACGDVSSCEKPSFSKGYSFAVDYWITPFVAAEVSYLKPGDVTITGSGTGFHFDSHLQTALGSIVGKAGVPAGPTRVYGFGGLNRHQSTLTTNNTIDNTTVTVNGVTQTVVGGTQTFAQQTEGWNWLAGGGVEAWVTHQFAFYGELTIAKIKGAPISGGEGGIDDRATSVMVGLRFHVGR